MFSFFKRKPPTEPSSGIPRGVLPTYVTDKAVILVKASPQIRNTYEIRLALFMAKSKGLRFVLGVSPEAKVDESLVSLLKEHGGAVERGNFKHYSVYIGCEHPDGSERGWVLGAAEALTQLSDALQSEWLRDRLAVGARFDANTLEKFETALKGERLVMKNIDDENLQEALLNLLRDARQTGGSIFIQ